MTGTIELLETIGRDASLRHASPYDLEQALAEMGASEGLKMAAVLGDGKHLRQELGSRLDEVVQVNQNPHPTNTVWNPDGNDDCREGESNPEGNEKDDSQKLNPEP